MARTTTRSSSSSRKRDRPQSTGAFWFLLGTLVGAFGMGLAWMRHDRLPAPPETASATEAPTPKPTFDFFDTLPREEVLVPVETPATESAPPTPPKPASETATTATQPKPSSVQDAQAPKPSAPKPSAQEASASAKYRLQVGSFRNLADAERRKAELALLGFGVDIVEARVDGAKTYRLRTGQYDKAAADALGKKLQARGVSSMAVRDN